MVLKCTRCHKEILTDSLSFESELWHEGCGGLLEYTSQTANIERMDILCPEKGIWSFKGFLPDITIHLTLGEAHTPLLSLNRIIGLENLRVKVESRNPTGSFRDRAAVIITSYAKSIGMQELWCATNGNFGASLSAYCASAGLKANVVVPRTVDIGKKSQIYAFGAQIIEKGEVLGQEVFQFVQEQTISNSAYQATPEFNILAIEGQKTLGLELSLESQVETIIVPLGSGSLLYSIWRGLKDALANDILDRMPRLVGVQVEASDKAITSDNATHSTSRAASLGASSLIVGQPLFAEPLQRILESCDGFIVPISPEDLVPAAIELATEEGLFVEPGSASVIAATKELANEEQVDISRTVVVLTGEGLKSPNIYAGHSRTSSRKVWGLGATITRKFEILEIIKKQESAFGYSIWHDLGGKGKISRQAVYQHLRELVEKGLIFISEVLTEKRHRRYYKLTPKGMKALESMKNVVEILS